MKHDDALYRGRALRVLSSATGGRLAPRWGGIVGCLLLLMLVVSAGGCDSATKVVEVNDAGVLSFRDGGGGGDVNDAVVLDVDSSADGQVVPVDGGADLGSAADVGAAPVARCSIGVNLTSSGVYTTSYPGEIFTVAWRATPADSLSCEVWHYLPDGSAHPANGAWGEGNDALGTLVEGSREASPTDVGLHNFVQKCTGTGLLGSCSATATHEVLAAP